MRFDADALTRLRRVGEVAVAPDGSWLAAVVTRLGDDDAYASDLWRVPVEGGAAAAPLTRGPSRDTSPRFGDGGALYFLSDRKDAGAAPGPGDDRVQVWCLPAAGGEPVPVTDEPLGVAAFAPRPGGGLVVLAEVIPGVAHAEQRARAVDRARRGPSALRYRDPPVRHWDRWLPDTGLHVIAYDGAGARTDLTPDALHHARNQPADTWFDVSPDGARVAIAWGRPSPVDRMIDSVVRVIELATGAAIEYGAAPTTQYSHIKFAPDGRRLAAVRADRRSGKGDRARLWLFDGDPDGRALDDWDAQPVLHGWTRDGRALYATADDDGRTPVFRIDTTDLGFGEITRVTDVASGGYHDHVRALADGRVVGVRHRLTHPPEPFVCDGGGGAPRLLASLSGFTDDDGQALASVEYRTTPGDGGTPVGWFLVRPNAGHDGRALVWIHGGPHSQNADGWHWRWNPMVAAAAGYAVALPNPRGSTGRGQQFLDEVQGNQWGGACFRDLMAVTDELERLPGIDARRVAVMGGSFGGYMANWIGTQTDRFRAIVTHASIVHFDSFWGVTDYPAWFTIEMGVNPFESGDGAWSRYSPHAQLARWQTPTLILHGEKDYRVPIGEALYLFESLRVRGVDAELIVFPDENHWIQKPRNIRAWYAAWQDFLATRMP